MPIGLWNFFCSPRAPLDYAMGGKRGKAKRRAANKAARAQRKRGR